MLFDAGYDHHPLQRFIHAQGWHWICATRSNRRLGRYPLTPGRTHLGHGYRWSAEVDNWRLKERFGLADYRLRSIAARHTLVFAAYVFLQAQRIRPLLTNPKARLCPPGEVLAAHQRWQVRHTVLHIAALVPDLTPERRRDLLRAHLDRRGFTDIEIIPLRGEHYARTQPEAPVVQAAIRAARTVYGYDPVLYPLSGGSGPMYPLSTWLGIPTVCAGTGYTGSRAHAPNEHIRLDDYWQCQKFTGEFFKAFAEMG